MTLLELQEQIKHDLKLNGSELFEESLRTPDLHNKYSKILMVEKMALKKLEREMNVLHLERWEYYRKKSNPQVYEEKPLLKKILDTDVKHYLAADSEILTLQAKIDAKEELVEFLKRTMDQIMQRNWNIRNAIEFYKFTTGVS